MTEYVINYEYNALLAQVLNHGVLAPTRQGPRAYTCMQAAMTFDLESGGFPVITERSLASFWRAPIGELCAFINGATTLDELEKFGCKWWGPWATAEKSAKIGYPPGHLGSASYGGAFHNFPMPGRAPEGFDQFKHLVEQIRELPDLRTHFVSPWIPYGQMRGAGKGPWSTIAPCHGWVHVRVLGGKLHLHMFQRSGDVPVGVPSNMIQYAALMLMLEHLTGYRASTYYHTISDAHIYEDQVDVVREMIRRGPSPLPRMFLNDAGKAVTDIHDFRAIHFDLADYNPHPAINNIPVGI